MLPIADCPLRMVGRAVRQRDANAPRPFRSRRFDPCTIRHVLGNGQKAVGNRTSAVPYGLLPIAYCLLPTAQLRHVRLAAEDAGPSNRMARVRIPHVAPIMLPLRLAGRAPGFELGRLGSNPRGATMLQQARNSSVGRAGVSYASSAAGSIPASATIIRRLSQVGRQRVVAPS